MFEFIDWLKGKKTYIICVSAILGALGAWLGDEITLLQLIEAVIVAIGGISMRAGITKSAVAK